MRWHDYRLHYECYNSTCADNPRQQQDCSDAGGMYGWRAEDSVQTLNLRWVVVRSEHGTLQNTPLQLCVSRADAQLDAAAVPALLGAPAAVLRKLGSAARHEQLATLAGRRVIASMYAGVGSDSAVHIAAVGLLDADGHTSA